MSVFSALLTKRKRVADTSGEVQVPADEDQPRRFRVDTPTPSPSLEGTSDMAQPYYTDQDGNIHLLL